MELSNLKRKLSCLNICIAKITHLCVNYLKTIRYYCGDSSANS